MYVATTIAEAQAELLRLKSGGAGTVGLTPTMGYIHDGHLSLARAASAENDISVTSIFVNPLQFGPSEDFEAYPRDSERDYDLLKQESVDLIFDPEPEEMYPSQFHTGVRVRKIADGLCGSSRPGHFDGVATVVTKLFNIIRPDRAYFGFKDAQQVRVIESMVRDLNLGVEVRALPIVREADGLAMSSRNVYLNPEQRASALSLSRSLRQAEQMVSKGERDAGSVRAMVKELIEAEPETEIDYIELVDWVTFDEVKEISGDTLLALAVFLGKTRLIDNTILHAGPTGDAARMEEDEQGTTS